MAKERADKRILCVGTVCVDVVCVVAAYPEEDSDQRTLDQWKTRGGNASNMTTVLSELGVASEFMGPMATEVTLDMKFVEGDFWHRDIAINHCPRHMGTSTPTSFIILNKANGSRTILHTSNGMPELTAAEFRDVVFDSAAEYSWVHFEGRPDADSLAEMARGLREQRPEVRISVEFEKPNRDLTPILAHVDLLIVSKEFAAARGAADMAAAVDLFPARGIMVVCTWADRGAAARDSDGTKFSVPACPPSNGLVVDTIGAGDTFNSALIAALSLGKDLRSAVEIGCKVAGHKVGLHRFEGLSKLKHLLDGF